MMFFFIILCFDKKFHKLNTFVKYSNSFKLSVSTHKGQLNSEWIYEVIISPKDDSQKTAYKHQKITLKELLQSLFVW